MKVFRHNIQRFSIKNALKIDPVPTNIRDTGDNIITWGRFNDEPFRIVETIKRSITGAVCADVMQQYIYGNGIADKEIGSIKVNEKQTLDMLAYELAGQVAKLRGLTVNCKYLRNGKIGKLYTLPFEGHRLSLPDDRDAFETIDSLVYNPYFGTGDYKKMYNRKYPLFDPEKLGEHVMAYGDAFHGQVYRSIIENEYNRFYPNPSYWADNDGKGNGKDAMESEFLLQRLLNKELDQGFMQNMLMKVVGDPDEPLDEREQKRQEAGKKYITAGEELNRYLNEEFSGVDGPSMMVLWSKLKEDFPELDAFPTSFNYEKLQDVRATIKSDVATAWRVPLLLVNVQTSGTISKDDTQSTVHMMHSNVRFFQHMIERALTEIMEHWQTDIGEIRITNYNPFPEQKDVPDKVWQVLTVEEQRNWVASNTDIEIDLIPDNEEEENEQIGCFGYSKP